MTQKPRFSVDQLEFREITRESSPATFAQLVAKEAVHPLSCTAQLLINRLAPDASRLTRWDKHCFGLFAPGSDIPEVAVFAKLMPLSTDATGKVANSTLPGSIDSILEEPGATISAPNTAIFYTITNPAFNPDGSLDPAHPTHIERAANGETAGERLIKQIASRLSGEGINNFSTLSPLRKGTGEQAEGFAQWLDSALQSGKPLFTPLETQKLATIAASPAEALKHVTQPTTAPSINADDKTFLQTLLKDLALHYLAEEKSPKRQRITRDPVAHFHLSNGAAIGAIQLCPPGHATASDTHGAHGLMVNYRYELDQVAARKQAYAAQGTVSIDENLARRHRERMEHIMPPTIPSRIARHLPDIAALAAGQRHEVKFPSTLAIVAATGDDHYTITTAQADQSAPQNASGVFALLAMKASLSKHGYDMPDRFPEVEKRLSRLTLKEVAIALQGIGEMHVNDAERMASRKISNMGAACKGR